MISMMSTVIFFRCLILNKLVELLREWGLESSGQRFWPPAYGGGDTDSSMLLAFAECIISGELK